MELYGNTQGLDRLIKRRLQSLYHKRVEPSRIIPYELAKNIMQISREASRQVGLLINRRGLIDYVIVGEKNKISIPPLSTERMGRARFRGLRLIHTHLNGELLSREDLTDLATLQLDMVAIITEQRGEPGETIHIGHLIPRSKAGRAWEFIGPLPVQELDLDFTEFITDLENEFVKERGKQYIVDENRDTCILVSVLPPRSSKDMDEYVAEMKDLCHSAGLTVVETFVQRPKELHPKSLIGKGKLEEIIIKCQQMGVDLLVFDEELSPGQMKNISTLTELRVIDRNQLILDIFADRANTSEAKIQVELAQLRYILPRLSEKDIAFSRLTGGIGLRGPGETKLEIDKRRVREKISFLEKKLKDVRKVREKKRERRRDSGLPIVSVVGYTNSGKSTLLNLLTKSSLEAEDRPFSTLNPTTRLIKYPERKNIILTDTVGFIRELPKVLLRAFIATLEELEDAHLLLHLVDVSAPDFEDKVETVGQILANLNLSEKKKLLVFNKIDRIDRDFLENLENRYQAVSISALKGIGIDGLIAAIEDRLAQV